MKHDHRTWFLALAVSLVAVMTLLTCAAERRSLDQPSLTAMQAWQTLKDGNERFAHERLEPKDLGFSRRKELAAGQSPCAIVLSCSDSRVPPEIIFDQGLGEIFVVRVAGNVAEPFVLGSIDYAVEHLHVPLIVVLGHEECGAVKAALGKEKPAGNLGRLIREVHLGDRLPADDRLALSKGIENNVRYQAKSLTERSEIVRAQVEHGGLRIVAGVYGLSTGKVRWLEAK